tara:strand:- start:21453 stop:22328 length:876 start_codon:yes stop_codon:yes gene_type:complete
MNKKYCGICQKSIIVSKDLEPLSREIQEDFEYLKLLHRKIDRIRTFSRNLDMHVEDRGKGTHYYHNSPFLVIANNLLQSFQKETYFNLMFCPEDYELWFDFINNLKEKNIKNKEALNKLEMIYPNGENEKRVLSLMISVAPHIVKKIEFLIEKLEKLQLKNTLNLLSKGNDIWGDLKRGREHKNHAEFNSYKKIKIQPMSPEEYYYNLPKKAIDYHKRAISNNLYEGIDESNNGEYEVMVFDPVPDRVYIFKSHYGYYWIDRRGSDLELSKKFFITREDCNKDFDKKNNLG